MVGLYGASVKSSTRQLTSEGSHPLGKAGTSSPDGTGTAASEHERGPRSERRPKRRMQILRRFYLRPFFMAAYNLHGCGTTVIANARREGAHVQGDSYQVAPC